MKNIIIIAAVTTLALVGCSQRDQAIDESAGAQKDAIEESKDAQQDALDEQKKAADREARMQKKQIEAQADAQQESVEAAKDAEKAQLNAQEKQIEADASAQKAQVEANQEFQEAAGAAAEKDNSNSALEARVRSALLGSPDQTTPASTSAKDIKVSADNGTITLKGTVKTEAEKTEFEAKAKAVSGVTSVNNQLKIEGQ